MKRRYRILSFLLTLSLLFTSLVFTTNAAETESSNNIGDYIDEDVEIFTPSAYYSRITSKALADGAFNKILASGTETDYLGKDNMFGGNNVDTYLVSSDTYDDYIMFVPTEDAVKNKHVTDHVQLNTNVGEYLTYDPANPQYYVFEMDVTTESDILPIFYGIVARNNVGATHNGETINAWGSAWHPSNVANSLYMTMTPGIFHHLTFIGDIDNNVLYVYIDNQLVTSVNNGVTSSLMNQYYKENGTSLYIEGMRVQLNNALAVNGNMSYCFKNIYERTLIGNESGNLADYVGLPTLHGWDGNRYEYNADNKLPPIISINGTEYNNTVDATHALSSYKEGNDVKLMRSVLSGQITVDCDATIRVYSTDVSLIAGPNTTLTKVDVGTLSATLHTPKTSNTLVKSNPSGNLFNYLGYNLAGNLITSIELQNPGKPNTVNYDIMQSASGNQYVNMYDNSDQPYSVDPEVHAYLNAALPMARSNTLAGHDFIVYDFDIYSESEFINIYNNFIPRAFTDDNDDSKQQVLLSNKFYLTSDSSSLGSLLSIEMKSGIWNHFTFVGDIKTGRAYVYINNKLVQTIENGLYVPATNSDGVLCAKAPDNSDGTSGALYPLDDVCINMFRCMQIYGKDTAGTTLTQNMSVAADNFDARFVDGDSTLVAGMESLDSWVTNLYGHGYQFEEVPAIAAVDGVEYYDIYSLSEALNGSDYKTTKKKVNILREFVGYVNVSCRAEIHTNGFAIDNLVFADTVRTTDTTDDHGNPIKNVYYVETEDIPGYTKEWTETETQGVTGTFDKQKTEAANNSSIFSAIKSGAANNRYTSHAISNANVSWLACQLLSYTPDGNGVYTATYDNDKYLLDKGAQSHTLNAGNITVTPTYEASASIANNLTFLGSGSTTLNSFNSTEVQYYLITEFDFSNITVGSNKSTVTANLNVGSTSKSINVISDLAGLLSDSDLGTNKVANNVFAHVTIIGEIDVTPTTTVTRSSSGITYSYNYQITNYSYSATFKVYVNNTLVDTVTSNLASAESTITWTGMSIGIGSGNETSIDNVYMNYGSETITTTVSNKTISVSSNASTNATNLNSTVNNNATPTESTNTTIDEIFTTSTIVDNTYGKTANYELPPSYEVGTTEEIIVDTEEVVVEKTEEVPPVLTPIAYVNGTLYNSNQEAALREVLANSSNSKDVLNVMILREPSEPYTVGANAVIDTNGLSSDIISYDVGNEYEIVENGDITSVIVIGNTRLIAKLNGTEYYDVSELQMAISISKEAALEFYSQPASALKITCPAVITTNGFTNTYTVDEYVYYVSESNGTVTITEHTSTPKIRVIVGGVETVNENVPYGTDIAEYLKENGILASAVAENGNIYTGITFAADNGAYLVDGKPAGRITDDVTFTVSHTQEWTEPYIIINNDGNIVDPGTYNDEELIRALATPSTNAVILGEDVTVSNFSSTAMANSGHVHFYLNGHTFSYPAPNNATHLFVMPANSTADYSIFGPGVIDSTTISNTQGIFYSNVGYSGTIKFQDLTINTSHAIGQLRDGHMEIINCDVNAYVPTTRGGAVSVSLTALISLGEDFNTTQSKTELSLIISQSDVDFRYYEIDSRYADHVNDIPLIQHKIVTTNGTDPKTTVLIDNSTIKAQGSLINAYETNDGSAPEASNMKFWINESSILAKAITSNDIKSGSVIFYENVKTNIADVNTVSFTANLVKSRTGDGVTPYFFTSYDYAIVTWSNGKSEYWTDGSLPINNDCKFDNTQIVEGNKSYTFTATTTAAPFKLYANLTLSDVIGFNVYIPTSQNVSEVYIDGKLVEKGTKSDGSDSTYVVSAGTTCYFYSVYFAPQVAAKEFSLLIKLADGKQVSRTLSVGIYSKALYASLGSMEEYHATKNRELLSVALSYVEHAAMYGAYHLNMSSIASTLSSVGLTSFSPTATSTDMSGLSAYFKSAQINIDSTCAFRFNAKDGVNLNDLTDLTFTVDGKEREFTVSQDGSYAELSLRAFDMVKTITINVGGNEGTYDLYTYYAALNAKAGTSTTEACAANQALQIIKALYTYAAVAEKYPVAE